MRRAKAKRKTAEVSISINIDLDGKGTARTDTGNRFLDHLIRTLARHSLIDITIEATGDLKHHLTEDVALTLGEAICQALGNKKGIRRFGSAHVPMDDSLARAAIDLGGRPYVYLDLKIKSGEIEDLKTEDIEHFFASLAQTSKSNIHVATLYGTNDHHKVEAATKALALALREALSKEPRTSRTIPSVKGEL
ncbi:imidazoleglycerol-phosphate dehydratase HisB [Candidatus Bathyarchaeota archaeon]|nr:imidazoleglycerol-phosphate dehydratase HisB [Candidatus Bathyarchaeota archaeon]